MNTNINILPENHSGKTSLNPYEQIVGNSPVANIVCLSNGIIEYANPAAAVMFGYNEGELTFKNIKSLFPQFDSFIENGEQPKQAAQALKKSGCPFHAQVFANLFEAGEIPKVNLFILEVPKKTLTDSGVGVSDFLDNSEEALLVISKNFELLDFTAFMYRCTLETLGVELKRGMNMLALLPPDKVASVKAYHQQAFQGNNVVFDYALELEPDKAIYYHNIVKPFKDKDGEVKAVFVSSKNITGQKNAEQKLDKSEQRLRFALEGTQQGVWDWNLETGKVHLSAAWKKIIGYEEHEILNSNEEFIKRLHPDDRKVVEKHIETHLKSTAPYYESEYRLQAKDGQYRWILSRGMIIERDAEERPTRVIGTITDITDRKTIEDKFRLLFYNNPLPMWTYCRRTLRLLDVNNAAIKHYGYKRQEFLSMSVPDIISKATEQDTLDSMAQPGAAKQKEKLQQHKQKNGNTIYVHVTEQVFDEQKNDVMLVLAEDVTDKILAAEQLKVSEKRYKSLFKQTPLPSYIYDMETLRFLEVNDAAVKYYGYTQKEFLKMSLLDLHLPELHDQLRQSIQKHKSHSTTRISNWRQISKDGLEMVVDLSTSLIEYNGVLVRRVLINDVTEKARVEQELRNANHRFELVVQSTSDIIWDWDLKNTIVWSENYTKIFGWPLPPDRTTKAEDFFEYIHPDDIPAIKEELAKFPENPDINWEFEFRFRKADGTYAYIRDKGVLVKDKNGVVQRVIGAMQDITERKLREQKLIEINERYRLAMKATSDVIYDWNLQSDHLQWSAANLQKVFGWTDQEVSIEQWKKLIHPSDRARVLRSVKDFIADSSRHNFSEQYRFRKKEGGYCDVLDRAFIIRGDAGEPMRIIGAMQDITEMKTKEKELLRSNERFEMAAMAATDVLWETDFVNKTSYISPVFKDLFGFEVRPSDYYKNWIDFIHPDDRPELLSMVLSVLNDSSVKQFQKECRHIKADGSYAYLDNHFLILRNDQGKPIKLVGAIKDITKRKAAQEELIRTNERFQFAASATSDIIWDWDLEQNKVLLSDNYQRVLGWEMPSGKLFSYTFLLNYIHPDDKESVNKKLETAINDPHTKIWDHEYRYLKADGSYAYVINRGFIIRDKDGKAQRIIGAIQDISERKYLEELQSLELRVFEVSAVPGIHFHNVLKTLMNGYESLHTGIYTSICLLGLNDEIEILAPKLAKEHCRQLRYFIEKQKAKLQTAQAHNKNIIISSVDSEEWKYGIDTANHYNWKMSWTIPVYHHSGELLAFITIFLDQEKTPSDLESTSVTRLRNLLRILIVNHLSLEQIRISNERYYNVQKATHDMVWDWNLETGIFYRNPEGVKKVYGVEDVETIQNVYSWMERIHPEDHIKVQNVINNILHATDEDSFDVEYRYKRDDGSYSFIFDRGIIVRNKEGRPLRMIGAAQDVTDRKRLEQELLEKELEKQRSISQATIDTQEEERREIGKELHDNVNQVLTTTKLYLDLSASSPELKDELIRKSSKNIIYVINEIRQLSRSLMDPSIGDLGLIDSINDLIDNINITRKLHVSLSADKEIEKHLEESQKLMVFRIIQEAMNNTIKYAQATSVHLTIKNKNGMAELLITDDGKGFNPKTVKKGAGLKNIQNRVYLTNGKLLIDSAPGKGCKIVINFPITNKKSS